MAVNVTYVQAGGYAASVDRMGRAALVTKSNSGPNKARTGVFPFNSFELLPTAAATPNMTTLTAPGSMVIADANGGAYTFVSDASVTVTHNAANGTNPRIDLVIARVYDNEAGDAASTTSLTLPGTAGTATVQTITGTVEVVTGTPAASPTAPALPTTRCVVLAQVTVRAAATSVLNSDINTTAAVRVPWTVAAGGVLPLTSVTAAPTVAYKGMYADANDTNLLMRSDGTNFATVADPAVFTPWIAYTPVWNGTNPNGTIAGSYKKIGFTVYWRMRFALGTGATGPGGVYTWSLPVAALAPFGTAQMIGRALYFGGTYVIGEAVLGDTTHVQALFHGQTTPAQSGVPGTWVNGSVIEFSGVYESSV